MPSVRALGWLAAFGCTISLGGCISPPAAPTNALQVPTYDHGGAKCTLAKSSSAPLVVDWSNVDRARLEAMSRSGVVIAQYAGCELKIVPSCSLPETAYRYVGTTRKHDEDHIRNADDLYAKLPLGATRLEGTLARAGELSVGMTIVGRYQLDRNVTKSQLVGDCHEATHVITALTVGAFAFSAGARAKVAGEASAFGGSAGGSTESQRDVLTEDGSDDACNKATEEDKQAPAGCGALIRIELATFPEVRAQVEFNEQLLAKQRDERNRQEESARSRRTLGMVIGGGGLAFLGGGVASVLVAGNARSSIRDGGLDTSQDIRDAESRAQTFDGLSIAAFSLGGAALITGAILYLTAGSSSSGAPQTPTPSSASLRP
jgi:hypothetical protein